MAWQIELFNRVQIRLRRGQDTLSVHGHETDAGVHVVQNTDEQITLRGDYTSLNLRVVEEEEDTVSLEVYLNANQFPIFRTFVRMAFFIQVRNQIPQLGAARRKTRRRTRR